MRVVRYKQSEYLVPWRWRKKKPLYRFILEIPYGLYWSVVPGREALNELLRLGEFGGGMSPGTYWEPFEIGADEYREVTEEWKTFDLRRVFKARLDDIPDLSFVFDDEITAVPRHLDYLKRSSEKYAAHYGLTDKASP